MLVTSWNVNGWRACLGKGFDEFLQQQNADIFCLQETKMQPDQLDRDFADYTAFWNSAVQKGYSGTAILTRRQPLAVVYGMNRTEHDQEGRLITLEFDAFFLVNVYTPNSQQELAQLSYRLQWEDDFRSYLCVLDRQKPVIICGDLNVAHHDIDIKNPKTNRRSAGFTDEERGKLTELLACGFTDSFRHLYPNQTDAYTWWSYLFHARSRNAGWRIDYCLVSNCLTPDIKNAGIHSDIFGSDHCPVSLVLHPVGL